MKQTVNQTAFIQAFQDYDRYEQFGYSALCSLFGYFEQLEDDLGEEIELDVIGICCDYCVNDPKTIAQDYSIDIDGLDDDDSIRDAVLEYLNDNTTVVDDDVDGNILYCSAF